MDHLTVRVEARPDAEGHVRDEAAAAIARQVKDGVGVSVEVLVVDPETLERSVGKLRRVRDLRTP
jgi:phenylacetate-CoA ligase